VAYIYFFPKIVGYLFRSSSTRNDRRFTHPQAISKDLTEEDIFPFEPQTPVHIYGMANGVKPGLSLSQKCLYGERLILGAKSALLELGKQGIIIRHIIAHSSMPDGIRLMRHIEFSETSPKAAGLRDFFIDMENSGIPFMREYKEALKKARAQNTINWGTKTEDSRPKNVPVPFNKQR
jgi:hypothetical protein